jgi:hypothetical protein
MPKMKALRSFPFGSRQIAVGDEVDASSREAKLLDAMKWAEPVPTYQTRVMTADSSNSQGSRRVRVKRDANVPKRQYRRRDKQAGA